MNEQRPCEVCGAHGAHGNHFGATSCRACAAFFRRGANSKWSFQKFQTQKCSDLLFCCKPCRLKRCFDVGMSTSNFQYNRDGLNILKTNSKIPQTLEKFVGRPEVILFWDSQKPIRTSFLDVSHLIKEALNIFRLHFETVYKFESSLHRLTMGLTKSRTEDYKTTNDVSQKFVVDTWRHYFLRVAKWLTHFEEFQKQDEYVKLKILECIWHIWATLDWHSATAIYRRSHPNASPTQIVSRQGVLMDLESTKFDSSWLSDYPAVNIAYFLRQSSRDNFDIIASLQDLQPTDIEMTFMLAQLSFEYAGKRCQGEILKITEKFQQILANDLHDYYVDVLKMPKYFDRLAKLMKINNSIQRNLWEHRPKMEVAKVFKIMKIEFSHPEMFRDSGFN